MLFVALPSGDYGAGVRGDSLFNALASMAPTARLRNGRELPSFVPGPLLQFASPSFRPWPKLAAPRHVGYAVFDMDLVAARTVSQVQSGFDVLITASRWCESVLRDAGLKAVTTIHAGIDREMFRPEIAIRRRFDDRFVVFSGGRFCLQKSQDIVLEATKVLAERHPEVLLLAAWTWPASGEFKSMKASPYHRPVFDGRYKDADDMMRQWIREAKFDPYRIEFVPKLPHANMAAVYGDSDVGLFPNRCEGDTNLMMMEYMACGRPAIATDFSGHRDIVSDKTCLPLRSWRLSRYIRYDNPVACWCDPDLEETIEALEYAYQHRDRLASLGRSAAAAMQEWTWERTARCVLELLD